MPKLARLEEGEGKEDAIGSAGTTTPSRRRARKTSGSQSLLGPIVDLDPLGRFEPVGQVVRNLRGIEEQRQDRPLVLPGEGDLLAHVARGKCRRRADSTRAAEPRMAATISGP